MENIPEQVKVIAEFLAALNKSDNPIDFWFDAENLWDELQKVAQPPVTVSAYQRPDISYCYVSGNVIVVAFIDGSATAYPMMGGPATATATATSPSTAIYPTTVTTSGSTGYYTSGGVSTSADPTVVSNSSTTWSRILDKIAP